ncbi:unnamed protein product [Parnassius apollo]|uniref:(apollo) hypothetical protein n=1 Tax=Parnassius apollo TaxID=110799 RepID=A0A8S3Y9Q8_PARAO|nr:unnamed protein product [Parnassius apollo]
MATNVTQGPDSNPLNSAETEVEKSDNELILLSQMQNENVRDSELLLPTSNIVQDDLNKFPTAEETIKNKENLLSHKKISRELKTSKLNYYCEEESPKLSPIVSDQYILTLTILSKTKIIYRLPITKETAPIPIQILRKNLLIIVKM